MGNQIPNAREEDDPDQHTNEGHEWQDVAYDLFNRITS
jgi:hypothetical protein